MTGFGKFLIYNYITTYLYNKYLSIYPTDGWLVVAEFVVFVGTWKIKTFIWRACLEASPTKSSLHRRNVTPDPRCASYSNAEEDCLKALWSCSCISALSPFRHHQFCSLSNLVRNIQASPACLGLEKFVVTAWLIWNKRNQSRLDLPSVQYTLIWP